MSQLVRDKGEEHAPKTSTRVMLKEIAQHTKVPYRDVSAIVYAFLHYVKYSVLATQQRVVIRNFGTFYPAITRGRVYGSHVDAPTYHPDRIKVALTSPLMEVERWKNTQSIQNIVATARDAGLKLTSMDLSVCARIADLVLSNKPVEALSEKERLTFLRAWVLSTGASPLLPAAKLHYDPDEKPYYILKFRLVGRDVSLLVFNEPPNWLYASAIRSSQRDLVILPEGWASLANIEKNRGDVEIHPFGKSPEEQCSSLYQAYKAVKYGS